MIQDILNGYKNYFLGSDNVTLEIAKQRAKVCVSCPFKKEGKHAALLPDMTIGEIKGFYCGDCKCPLSVAVRSKGKECPKGYWK